MGENRGCWNPVRSAAFKQFKSVYYQDTILKSCQLKLLTLNLLTRCESKQLRTNFINHLKILQKKQHGGGQWRMLWQWVNFRTFWGSSNSNTLISDAAATMLKDNTIQHEEYNQMHEDIAARSRYLGHVYIITSRRILCDVITYPLHNKISMQLKGFTAACMKMGTRMCIWILKDISQQYSPTRAS